MGKSIINTSAKMHRWTKEEIEKIQEGIEFKKEYNKETHEFLIVLPFQKPRE